MTSRNLCISVLATTAIVFGTATATPAVGNGNPNVTALERERFAALAAKVWSRLENPAYWEQVAMYNCITSQRMAGLAKGEVTEMAMEYHELQTRTGASYLEAKCKKPTRSTPSSVSSK